jgi:replication-associated recombination protein RarA
MERAIHYDLAGALQKSMRARLRCDSVLACRMLAGGEDRAHREADRHLCGGRRG